MMLYISLRQYEYIAAVADALSLTAAAAAQRGYLVSVIEDCCADKPEAHVHTLERYPFIFDAVTADDIVDRHDHWVGQIARLP